ncbi:MAG: hypothetical protein V2A54_08750 [Bacteroidota bacterium]
MKNKIKTYQILLCIFVMAFFFSCHKKKECDCIINQPPEYTAYWLAPLTSWWVYKSSDTTQGFDTASVITMRQVAGYVDDPKEDPFFYCHKRIGIDILHRNSMFLGDTLLSYVSYPVGYDIYRLTFGSVNFNTTHNRALINYPLTLGSNNNNWLFNDILSIQLTNYSFSNVWHLKNTVDNTQLFFAPNVGLVKVIKPDGTVWEVVNYQMT